MKKIYNFILLFSMFGWSQVTIFSENIGTATGTIAIETNVFQNTNVTFSGNADTRSTSASTGYTGASGGRNVFFGTASSINARNFIISGINTTNYSNVELSFGMVSPDNLSLLVEYSTNGTDFTPITFSNVNAAANWKLITIPSGVLPSALNLTLRFSKNDANTYRVDDIILKGIPTSPTLSSSSSSISGLYGVVNAGASTALSFSITGVNLNGSAVTLNLPTNSNFEISETVNGTYSSSINFSAFNGTETNVFVRLKQGLSIANYNDTITITGGGASTINVNIAGKIVEKIFLIYEFTGNSIAPTQTPENAVTTDFQVNTETLAFGVAQPETWTGSGIPYTNSQTGWATTAVTNAKNFFFNVTPNQNYNINATNISFEYRATGNGPSAITVEINGNVIETFNAPADITSVYTKPLTLQNQTSLNVKIYGWNNASRATDGSGFFRIDDVRINGETFNPLNADKFNNENSISLYPNPTSNGNVIIKSDLIGMKNILLYDFSGREVLNTNILENNFNVNGLNSGVYLVKITAENKSFTSKLIIK
jgi:Secretion system C-terminal sorting domain